MKYYSSILLLFLSLSVSAQTKWKVVSSSVTFKIKHVAGATADGSFRGLKADIQLDSENPANASIFASIESATFQTGNNTRDKAIKGENYFDVTKYPNITMKSQKIIVKDDDTFEGVFKLTIKSTTKEIPIKFSLTKTDTKGVFKSNFIINRIDFGVGEKSWLLADEANVSILVNAEW